MEEVPYEGLIRDIGPGERSPLRCWIGLVAEMAVPPGPRQGGGYTARLPDAASSSVTGTCKIVCFYGFGG